MNPAARMLLRRIRGNIRRYRGDPEDICRQIIEACWNGRYLQVSDGHFQDFYCRDFGMCAEALLACGYREYVVATMEYALRIFDRYDRITTTILKNGKPKDYFHPGIDSLPFLLRTLRLLANSHLIVRYRDFLQRQIDRYSKWIDPKTGLVRSGLKLSTMKDHHQRKSSCYANCMAGMCAMDAEALGLRWPYDHDPKTILMEHFYNGSFFDDDLGSTHVAGDANTFPFYCGIVEQKKIFISCQKHIKQAGLDDPASLKYTAYPMNSSTIQSLLAPNYEGNTVWMHLGLCYCYILKHFNKAELKNHLATYTELIVRHKNFLEVFNPDLTPYRSPFYLTDESMSWAVMYLHLMQDVE